MIIVSLATKPEYEASKATHFNDLGAEVKANVVDKAIKPGFFGWLGASKGFEKAFWTIVFAVFGLHYVLAFLFHVEFAGIMMVWLAAGMGVVMILLLGILGFRDIFHIVRDFKAETLNEKQ